MATRTCCSGSIGRCLTTLQRRPVVAPLSSVQFLSTGSNSRAQVTDTGRGTDDAATKIAFKDGLLVADSNETSRTKQNNKRPVGSTKRYSSRRSNNKKTRKSGSRSSSSKVPVLVPGGPAESNTQRDVSSLPRTFYHAKSHRFGGGGSYPMTQVFSTVNFSAMLDPKDYIKKSAMPGGIVTISGADAARRLLRGRQAIMDVMRKELSPKKKRHPPKPYALIGHGVPKQLLQDHINMADSLLTYYNSAAECSFTNFHGDLSFNWVRIRSQKGDNKARQWPPDADHHPDWEMQMELYMTVMNRLATNLGMVLRKEQAPPLMSVTVDGEDDDDFVATSVTDAAPNTPRYWSVELLRGMAYPPHLLPKQESLSPIIEWSPRDSGISAPGHVCIRLQGTPTTSPAPGSSLRRKKKIPVTLVFDACFRDNTATTR